MSENNRSRANGGRRRDAAGRESTLHHEWNDETPPSVCVVETVAAATNTEPNRLQPLYETVDPDALDRLLGAGRGHATTAPDAGVTFRYEGCDVTVSADGRVAVVVP